MSYGSPSAGYGQPDLQLGMHVSSDNGWTGSITEIIPAAPGYDGAVRVAWHGDGTTLVALSMFVVENGQAIIRTQPPPPPPPPVAPPPVVREATPNVVDDDLQTRLSTPVQNDPSHVNPYVNDPPLVTPEPAPIHPTHGGQMRDDDSDATYVPQPVHREPVAAPAADDLDMTYIPPIPRETRPEAEMMPTPPVAHDAEPETVMPAMTSPAPEPVMPDAGATTPLDAMAMQPGNEEVTVPVIEEHVEAHAEWRDAGAIVVRTVSEEVPQTLTHETQREELFVERVAVGRELAADEEVATREEGDTTIIPVIVEEAVVTTRRILAEELRVTKRMIPTTQTIQTTVRKEHVEVDAGNLADRVHEGPAADATSDGAQAMRRDPAS